jgi:hypothetical protein
MLLTGSWRGMRREKKNLIGVVGPQIRTEGKKKHPELDPLSFHGRLRLE